MKYETEVTCYEKSPYDHDAEWSNFLQWYNVDGIRYIPTRETAWYVWFTVRAHQWKDYAVKIPYMQEPEDAAQERQVEKDGFEQH